MRDEHTHPAALRKACFSLIELLTVMVLLGVLMAVAVPVALKLTSGSSVEAAARVLGAQLRLARQEAITARKPIAVLLPTEHFSAEHQTAYVGFRPCFVTQNASGDWVFDKWVENTGWSYVPAGAYIAEADQDGPTASNPQPDLTDGTCSWVQPPTDPDRRAKFVFTAPVRAIIFRPSGRLTSLQRDVTVVEGAVPPGATTPVTKNPRNWVHIEVNQYTGRVKFLRPEDPLS